MIVEDEKPLVVQRLAAATAGFSGAELANVVNEASLMAARDEREHLTILDLLDGVRRTRLSHTNVVNEASLMAARADREHLTILDLFDGVTRIRFDNRCNPQGGMRKAAIVTAVY
eukprot:gene4535-14703_t